MSEAAELARLLQDGDLELPTLTDDEVAACGLGDQSFLLTAPVEPGEHDFAVRSPDSITEQLAEEIDPEGRDTRSGEGRIDARQLSPTGIASTLRSFLVLEGVRRV